MTAPSPSVGGIDRKGVLSFLLVTFGITYTVELLVVGAGFRFDAVPAMFGQLVVAATMWVPAFATFVTIRYVTREGFAITNLRLGPWRPYLAVAILVPLAFAVVYGLTWLFGLASPDWQLTQLMGQMEAAGADMSSAPSPAALIPLLLFASLFVAPFINSLFGFGEEYGWRGYLLPKLMPLGKPVAYVLLGVTWGLWHAPLVLAGFNYPGYPVLGILGMIGLTTTLGIFINEMALHYRSTVLAGWIHGVFNCQAYGIWRVLFPVRSPLLGGLTGLIGMAVWLVIGLGTMWYLNGKSSGRPRGEPLPTASVS